jgi:hypothetical protein
MEKTALNQAIALIEHYMACQEPNAFAEYHAASVALHHLQSLLPTEQQQITDAYKNGLTMGHVTGETALKSASDYFTTKYTTI